MIIDNEQSNKIIEWITEYTETGKMDIVTGYFTIGAIAYLSEEINEKIKQFRLILGDIVNIDEIKDYSIDLLNENITIDNAFKLKKYAKECVAFLNQDKVLTKTLEPNFCHAKAYIFHSNKDERLHYFISGSSNLTEAGIGMKQTNNVELNIAETGNNNQYKNLKEWFNKLWNRKEAHKDKTIYDENGKKELNNFKDYLIEKIQSIIYPYSPKEVYYKVLYELFGKQVNEDYDNPDFTRQIGRLENSVIYRSLYDFQKKGVLSLIKMIQKYDGAILADAVGLGKTWSALAVMKFFQLQGREIILLCPKKLSYNWIRYRKNQDSRFEKDELDYYVRYHTDLIDERIDKDNYKQQRTDTRFKNDKPKLFVIDESHNIRNDKSQRYKFLVEEILQKNKGDIKILMLSATPINNTLVDIRNQFKLITKGDEKGFEESLGIRNLFFTFRNAQKEFNEWRKDSAPKIKNFIRKLPAGFFRLTDSLVVARTRKMVEKQNTELFFPKKQKPENIFVTPKSIGNYESFEELFENFPPMLSAYQPSFYIKQEKDVSKLKDEQQRDRFLVKMLYILLVKRLESSWCSFQSTIKRVYDYHQSVLDKINKYLKDKSEEEAILQEEFDFDDIFDEKESEEFSLGKKRPVNLKDIDKAGNIENFKKDLKTDIEALDKLISNLRRFEEDIEKEKSFGTFKSIDDKLESLMNKIKNKQEKPFNKDNKKILIFTVYKDTALYLFEHLKTRGFTNIGFVSGDISKTDDSNTETKNFEPILEKFAPFTKLFNEKEWGEFKPSSDKLDKKKQYREWINWIKDNRPKTYEKINKPIDILIATDVLSEGQNLQDCDMVINYDIHWNPVRVIQRMGRIDRIGSPNDIILGINYWPSENIDTYLDLKGRIESRMAAMKLAGSEVHKEFTERFKQMSEDEEFEQKLNEKMIKQMQLSWNDIDENQSTVGFDNFSLEDFRQDLSAEMNREFNKYKNMPKAVYTGFKLKNKEYKPGLICLLGYPAKPQKIVDYEYKSYELIFIDMEGNQQLLNQKEVLAFLGSYRESKREGTERIDEGDEETIKKLSSSLKNWLNSQAYTEEEQEDGTKKKTMGKADKDMLDKIADGDTQTTKQMKDNKTSAEKYKECNFDLICWFLISE